MTFGGLAEDYPIWSTRFSAFAQTKGLFETLTDTVELPDRPAPLREDANNEQTREHEAQTQARATAVQEDESRKNQIWCYLAMTLDASSLMLIRHDCVNSKGLGDGQKAWQLLQQRFRSDETTTVISLMRQLARLQLREDEAIHQYFIRAQELVTRLHHAGEELSETLFNARVLNGLPQRYEHFVVQESFNPAENFVELRKRLTNFEESRRQRDDVEEDQHVAMLATNASHQIDIHSSFKSHPRKTFSKPSSSKGPRLCFVCNKPGHLAASCYKKDNAVCSICKAKGHLASACKHQQKSPHKGLASSLSADSSFEVSKTDLVVDSGSTDHMMIDKTWFKNYQKLETTVNNPDGGKTKVEGIGDVDVEARDSKGVLHKLTFEKVLHVPEYKTNLISVSSLVQKQHELFHTKAKSVLKLRSKESFRLISRGKLFFLPYRKEKKHHFSNLSGGTCQAKLWHKRLGHLNFRDVANTTDEASQASDFCETCALGKISKKPVPKVSDNKATQKLERVYSDVIGPVSPSSIGGNRYAISFIDEFSGYAVVKFMKYKTPAENNLKLEVAQEDSVRVDSHEFRSLVGSLIYLAKQTRPDIMWITNVLSRFMNEPTVEHFNAGKRVLRYLQCSSDTYEQCEPTIIGEDNQSCIKLATNPVLHKQSKHIERKYHFIRERVDDNSIKLIYTPTDEMAADLLTKSLPQQKLEQHREQLLGKSRFLPSGNNLSGGIGAQKRT